MRARFTRSRRRTALLGLAFAIATGIVAVLLVEPLRWRAHLLGLKGAGRLPDLSWGELVDYLPEGSGVYLKPLIESRNPYTTFRNRHTSPDDHRAGRNLFQRECAACHGSDARGATGPDLTDGHFVYGSSDWALFTTIRHGRPGTAMQPRDLAPASVWQLVAFIKDAVGAPVSDADGHNAEGASKAAVEPVTFEHLTRSAGNVGDWLTYSGAYDGQRFSTLGEIRRENVGHLAMKWLFQLPTDVRIVENSPLVAGHVMFVSLPPGDVWALDTRSGAVLWTHRGAPAPRDLRISVDHVNRGLAILGTTLYIARIDAKLVALNANTGKELSTTTVMDYRGGYSMTGAPLALRDVLVVGIGGGELGIRGFLDGYSPVDGKRIWRFSTVPGPGEPGHDTWGGESWKKGAAPTWLTGSYDPALDLVYWGVGNPGPDYQGDVRPGDNLYSNSVIALEAKTGRLRWHFQFTPHDEHDWDSNQIPVLVDHRFRGEPRKLMYWANRNGFYYVLDRVTGEFLHGRPFVKQTWAERLDANGRPVQLATARPTREGALVFPSMGGATNWWSPAYDPASNSFFVAAKEGASVFTNTTEVTDPDGSYTASSGRPAPGRAERWIRSLDAATGELRWQHRVADQDRLGGLLATSGGLVFGSDASRFLALDSRDGRRLWDVNAGEAIGAAPITYLADGRQHVTIIAGRTVLTFALFRPSAGQD